MHSLPHAGGQDPARTAASSRGPACTRPQAACTPTQQHPLREPLPPQLPCGRRRRTPLRLASTTRSPRPQPRPRERPQRRPPLGDSPRPRPPPPPPRRLKLPSTALLPPPPPTLPACPQLQALPRHSTITTITPPRQTPEPTPLPRCRTRHTPGLPPHRSHGLPHMPRKQQQQQQQQQRGPEPAGRQQHWAAPMPTIIPRTRATGAGGTETAAGGTGAGAGAGAGAETSALGSSLLV